MLCAKANNFEEPDAVIPHVRICEGAVWATGCSTLMNKIKIKNKSISCWLVFIL
jgi:hypothetical protein